MGYIRHNAIIATGCYGDFLDRLYRHANDVGAKVLIQDEEVMNGYKTLIVCPDGSKEGWESSNEGDKARESIIELLESMRYKDGSHPLEWVEVAYGIDDGRAEIVRDAWNKEK